jgi:Flp pilus assembly protein TadB
MEQNKLDLQMADLVWSISTGLRAGYSLKQIFAMLADEAPEPSASVCKSVLSGLEEGLDIEAVYQKIRAAWPGEHTSRLVDILLAHRKQGGNLPDLLDPLSDAFLKVSGSDPDFYPLMRKQADALHATVPERVQ